MTINQYIFKYTPCNVTPTYAELDSFKHCFSSIRAHQIVITVLNSSFNPSGSKATLYGLFRFMCRAAQGIFVHPGVPATHLWIMTYVEMYINKGGGLFPKSPFILGFFAHYNTGTWMYVLKCKET